MNIKIVSDSSSNVFALPGVDYGYVPLEINTELAEYVDDEHLDVAAMVAQIRSTKGKSGSACPNIQNWLDAFAGADQVFAVAISSNISGSCAAARQAAREFEEENPGAKAHVVDSLSAGPELRLLVEKLRQLVQQGLSFEEIKQAIADYQQRTHLVFSLESLTNFARNGRVSPAVAKIAGVLGIRIVGTASPEGTLQPLHKCRGEKKALEVLWQEMIARGFDGGRVCIAHSFNAAAANAMADHIRQNFPDCQIFIEQNRGLCCYYAEEGGLLIGFES